MGRQDNQSGVAGENRFLILDETSAMMYLVRMKGVRCMETRTICPDESGSIKLQRDLLENQLMDGQFFNDLRYALYRATVAWLSDSFIQTIIQSVVGELQAYIESDELLYMAMESPLPSREEVLKSLEEHDRSYWQMDMARLRLANKEKRIAWQVQNQKQVSAEAEPPCSEEDSHC